MSGCCDYDCNQGRDCPARATGVARVGKQHQRHEPNFSPVEAADHDAETDRHLMQAISVVLAIAASLIGIGLIAGFAIAKFF